MSGVGTAASQVVAVLQACDGAGVAEFVLTFIREHCAEGREGAGE